ncbi:hypothetical protein ARALYDRAFT_908753 [Arabidopsis lyrata subsp. lyrata]|uniref:Replication factor A C-terminal domain-containing protein n=1 Tax=Arabidopsis lyrata subsp. lyrata TaxID=81972 RepID=D7M0Q1_ARALL|nr:hypothetical protein ARALYDRAFT_908753 [Arabidopsis lyrata subsp. lyrata]
MMNEKKTFDVSDFVKVYLTTTEEEDLNTRGGGYIKLIGHDNIKFELVACHYRKATCSNLCYLVNKQDSNGRLNAAICCAPALALGTWGLLEGKKATGYPVIMEKLAATCDDHKRDITLADETKKTVVVSLWNDLATGIGHELLDMADNHPVIAIKSLKVGDFQEATKLKSWYDAEGKETSMSAIGSGMGSSANNGSRSMYSDRVFLSHITSNPSLGEEKPVFFSTRAYISFIKPDQTMWYRACKTCNKKVTEAMDSGYWCEGCLKKDQECSLRYIMAVKVSDSTGETWFSAFNDEAEKIIGCTADELNNLKSEEGEVNEFQTKVKEATWSSHLFRISITVRRDRG